MRYEKVYDAVLATPLTIEDIVAGEMFWGATRSFLNASFFLFAIAVIGLVKSPAAILLLPLMLLFGLMFGVIGMIFTALIPNISLLNYYFTMFITPLFLFSGIFFPVESLPRWAQTLAQFTPLYHVVQLSRGLVLGRISAGLAYNFLWIVGVTALLFLLPIALMKRRIIR
jgi:lipooligosaccharide transport system permease protein